LHHLLESKEHLVRLAGLFLAAFVLFLVLRAALVPVGFGKFGHYRAGALADVAARPVAFAGRQECGACHEDVQGKLHGGKHAGVGCEACHGPLARHAADPGGSPAVKPEPKALCPVCHAANAAKPVGFPQVDVKEHADGASCTDCHDPHHPDA
jgi:cytochrome c7-like protein